MRLLSTAAARGAMLPAIFARFPEQHMLWDYSVGLRVLSGAVQYHVLCHPFAFVEPEGCFLAFKRWWIFPVTHTLTKKIEGLK